MAGLEKVIVDTTEVVVEVELMQEEGELMVQIVIK